MFYQFFLSSQVKRSVIVSNKHTIYELRHELPNNISFKNLGNWGKLEKFHNFMELGHIAQSSSEIVVKILTILEKDSFKTEIEFFP